MAHETVAPWAEVVPGASYPMRADDLLMLPDDGTTYELVEGRLVKMPPSGVGASGMAITLAAALHGFVRGNKLGHVSGADGEYVLSRPDEPDTALAPDVAFVRADRMPSRDSTEWDRPWRQAPDLAAEITLPNQFRPEMAEKARIYLSAGTRLIWIIWPKYKQVDVWRHGADQPVQTLGIADSLDGLDVLPGFSYSVADLFT
ncbi:MAG TPA: Uma2 family endonuclease [Ktedonobacterales bacterium]|nr:Uma2 family endonuclease [Ktedonobacterales bacterium]